MEQWKPIPGYSDFEASSQGRIRNTRRKIIRKPQVGRGGYLTVSIRADAERYPRTRQLHRLVCLAFNGLPPDDKPMSCHKDDDKANNTPDNLYWGDAADNHADAVRNGKFRFFGK